MNVIQDAVQLKQSQVAKSRRRFLQLPEYRQRTMYELRTTVENRWKPTMSPNDSDEKYRESKACRLRGVEFYRQGVYDRAQVEFERALSPFLYCWCPNKTDISGFVDDDVEHVMISRSNGMASFLSEAQVDDVIQHLSVTLVNLSLAAWQLADVRDSLAAAKEALELWPKNLKAAYRAAWCLAKGPQAGGLELDQAVSLLDSAVRNPIVDRSSSDFATCAALLDDLRVEQRKLNKSVSKIMSEAMKQGALEAAESLIDVDTAATATSYTDDKWRQLWACPDTEVHKHLTTQCVTKLLPWLQQRGATGARGLVDIDPEFRTALQRYGLDDGTPGPRAAVIEGLHTKLSAAYVDKCASMRIDDVVAELDLFGELPRVQGKASQLPSDEVLRESLRRVRRSHVTHQ